MPSCGLGFCCRLGTKEPFCAGTIGCAKKHCCSTTVGQPPSPPPPQRLWGVVDHLGEGCFGACCKALPKLSDPFSGGAGGNHFLASKACDRVETEWCWSGFCGGGLCCTADFGGRATRRSAR